MSSGVGQLVIEQLAYELSEAREVARAYQELAQVATAELAAITRRLDHKEQQIESLRTQLRVLVGVEREFSAAKEQRAA